MASRKLKAERGESIKVHPIFKSRILDQMDKEMSRVIGNKIELDNVQKTRILTESLEKGRFNFGMLNNGETKQKKKKNTFV